MSNFKKYLTESSLSRVWQHIEKEEVDFAVLSAFRPERKEEVNRENHKELKSMVRSTGCGYIEMKGGYKGQEELSLFVPDMSKKDAIKLGQKFDQDEIYHKGTEKFVSYGSNKAYGVGTQVQTFVKGKGKMNLDFNKKLIKQFFSQLLKGSHRKKKFLFRVEEKEVFGFFQHAYSRRGEEPKWVSIYEEKI